jgi:hypothetical protein
MRDQGIEGMVNSSLWLERTTGVQTLSLGHSAFSRADAEMELSGASINYWCKLLGGWIWLSVREMDNASDTPDIWFNLPDGPEGWSTLRRFVAALERSGVKKLSPKPIRIGSGEGENSFSIF